MIKYTSALTIVPQEIGTKVYFVNHRVLFGLVNLLFISVLLLWYGCVYMIATAPGVSAYGWIVYALAATLGLSVTLMAAQYVLWVQKYYYFHKLRRQLAEKLGPHDLVELNRNGALVTITRGSPFSNSYHVSHDGEEYEIQQDDVWCLMKRTSTHTLQSGAKIDVPRKNFFVPDRWRLFRRLVELTK